MLFINVLFTVTHHHLCVCKCGVYAQCTCAHLCVWVWSQHWVFSSVALRLVFGTRSLTDPGSDVAGQRAPRSLLVPYPSTGSMHSVTLGFLHGCWKCSSGLVLVKQLLRLLNHLPRLHQTSSVAVHLIRFFDPIHLYPKTLLYLIFFLAGLVPWAVVLREDA